MSAITTRAGKGSALTNAEVDANFNNLNTDKAEKSITISAGTGLTGGGDLSGNRTLGLATSGVSPATYGGNNSIPTLAIDAYGRVTGAGSIVPSGTWNLSITGNAATVSSITSTQVTSALGYAPPWPTGAGASGTWGINITGNAATVTGGVYQNQYGSFQTSFTSNINANTNRNAGVYGSYASAATNTPTTSGLLWNATAGTDGSGDGAQIWQDYVTNNLYARQRWGGTWGSWLTILSSNNYNSYAPTLTGTGASGTWGISITGNAATITSQANSATITASTGVDANNIVRRDGSGYIYANHVNFNTSESENPAISSFITSNGDGWSRKSSLAHVKNQIRGVADGTWGISITGNANNITQYTINQSLGTGNQVTFDSVITNNNGNGTNVRLGDDVWIGDCNIANTFRVRGAQDLNQGYIAFGSDLTTLGRNSTGALIWGGVFIANSDARAPIFYDSNDTARYVDPNSTSLCTRQINVYDISGGATWSNAHYEARTNGAGQVGYAMHRSGHSHLTLVHKEANALHLEMNAGTFRALTEDQWINSKYFASSGAIYGTIFYDANDSSYYTDPTYVSRMSHIALVNSLILEGSGAAIGNSTGARLSENYGPIWNCSNSGTWHHQVINGSSLCGFTAAGTNWGNGAMVASSYMRAPILYDHNDTNYFCDPNSSSRLNQMTVGNGSFTYIYCTDDESYYGSKSIHANSNVIGFLNGQGGWCVYFDHYGNGNMPGSLAQGSDERLKKDWTELPNDFVERLATVKHGVYSRIDLDDARQAGASAQDMQRILPEVVSENLNGMLTLSYGNAALVSSIALAKRIVELERRLAALES